MEEDLLESTSDMDDASFVYETIVTKDRKTGSFSTQRTKKRKTYVRGFKFKDRVSDFFED